MWDNLKGYQIVLASQSPRRRELLRGLDLSFVVDTDFTVDEGIDAELAQRTPSEIVREITLRKARAYPRLESNTLLITADTMVVAPTGEILGKPHDQADAQRMLNLLGGATHQVITAVCLKTLEREECFAVVTEVEYSPLTAEVVAYYLEHYRPYDKAGAYGIQEWIGYRAIGAIRGSYYNVMGLPVHQLAERLATW